MELKTANLILSHISYEKLRYKSGVPRDVSEFLSDKTAADDSLWNGGFEIKKGTDTVGWILFHGKPNENHEVNIFLFVLKKHRNKGYMSEALPAVAKWVFRQKDVYYIRTKVQKDDKISRRTLEKSRFIIPGRLYTSLGEEFGEDESVDYEFYELEKNSPVWYLVLMCIGAVGGWLIPGHTILATMTGMVAGFMAGFVIDRLDRKKRSRS